MHLSTPVGSPPIFFKNSDRISGEWRTRTSSLAGRTAFHAGRRPSGVHSPMLADDGLRARRNLLKESPLAVTSS